MQCSQCQHDHPAGQKFCGECGARLSLPCPVCQAANPPANKFCGECGTGFAVAARPAADAQLGDAHPLPASSRWVADRFASPEAYTPGHLAEKILTARTALEGERERTDGTSACASASTRSRSSSGPFGRDLRMDHTAIGDTVNLAARLLKIAQPGQIVLSRPTKEPCDGFFVFDDLGDSRVKGKTDPVRAFAVKAEIRGRSRLEVSRARGLTGPVGRDHEIDRLRGALPQPHYRSVISCSRQFAGAPIPNCRLTTSGLLPP